MPKAEWATRECPTCGARHSHAKGQEGVTIEDVKRWAREFPGSVYCDSHEAPKWTGYRGNWFKDETWEPVFTL